LVEAFFSIGDFGGIDNRGGLDRVKLRVGSA
jgi:hypothetical protein